VAIVYVSIAACYLVSAKRIAQSTLQQSKQPSLQRLAVHAVMQLCDALQTEQTSN
jgi:hypothetical protein